MATLFFQEGRSATLFPSRSVNNEKGFFPPLPLSPGRPRSLPFSRPPGGQRRSLSLCAGPVSRIGARTPPLPSFLSHFPLNRIEAARLFFRRQQMPSCGPNFFAKRPLFCCTPRATAAPPHRSSVSMSLHRKGNPPPPPDDQRPAFPARRTRSP